jgi:hypothetical protein
MASVLCTGTDESLIKTRKLILERAGHKVVPALGEPQLIEACEKHSIDVAVIGQTIARNEKRRVLRLIRQNCPAAKVLELYSPTTGKVLPDADDWLEVPADVPSDLAERVSKLAGV